MLVEVHTGTRPGRPVVLLIVAVLALVGSLGVAFMQVRGKRALGPEARVGDTPLFVRPPARWTASKERVGEYYLSLHADDELSHGATIERRVRFTYNRRPSFIPPEQIIQAMDRSWREPGRSFDPTPAMIAGLPAVEVRRLKRTPFRGEVQLVETVLRVACSPLGDEISVEYTPYVKFTSGDLDLMDELCSVARLETGRAPIPAADALKRVGIKLQLPGDTIVTGSEFADAGGIYVVGETKGLPRYAIGVFRTWLPNGRRPIQLVREFAAERWRSAPSGLPVQESRRPDGASIAWIRNAGPRSVPDDVCSVGVVSGDTDQAALVMAFSDSASADEADAAARALAEQLEFGESPLPDLATATTAAAELIGQMQTGMLATGWWGRASEEYFFGRLPGIGEQALKRVRSGQGPNSSRGFKGFEVYANPAKRDSWRWQIDANAGAYTHVWSLDLGGNGVTRVVEVTEWRDRQNGQVARGIGAGREKPSRRFEVGPTFVPPPLEALVIQNAATKARGATWLCEQSAPLSEGTHYALIRNVGPDEQGRAQVLYQDDFWPAGIMYLHQDGELVSIRFAEGQSLMRIPPAEGQRIREIAGEP